MAAKDTTEHSVLLKVSDPDADAWNQLAARFKDFNLLQTWEWGEMKVRTAPWTVERLHFIHDGRPVGIAQVLLRQLPLLGGMAWVNRGPLWDLGEGHAFVPEIFTELHRRYSVERGLYLRLAPTLPDEQLPAVLRGNGAFSRVDAIGHQGGRLDLTRPVDTLRAGLRQNWRRFLVKAERLGTEVRACHGEAAFGRFLAAYGTILDHSTYRKSTTPTVLEEYQRQLGPDRKMIVFEASAEGRPVSWVVIATYGRTGEYLAAASLPEGRRLNCGQLLTWAAMMHLKERGFEVLDMGGFDPQDEASGVSHFKRGTNAVPYRLCTEIDAHTSTLRRILIRRAIQLGRVPVKLPLPRISLRGRSAARLGATLLALSA
jgi:hypothetical protein